MRNRIMSIQGLRAICFFQIFIAHTCFFNEMTGMTWLTLVPWALEFFMILSGFGMYLGYKEKVKDRPITLLSMTRFALSKIKKVYPLHIFMLLVALAFWIIQYIGGVRENIVKVVGAFLAQLLLVQSWIPSAEIRGMFNGATWFLSTLIFCYALTIPLVHLIMKHKKSIRWMLVITILCRLVIGVLPISEYWIHIWPVSRSVDYCVGMLCAEMYMQKAADTSQEKSYSNMQTASLIVLVLSIIVCVLYYNPNYKLLHPNSILVMTCSMFVLYISFKNGIISKILSNKILVWFGDLSMELYLIHLVTIKFVWAMWERMGMHLNLQLVIVELVLTIAASIIWKWGFQMIISALKK